MKKFETISDLAKAVGGLGGHFRKSASHHEAMAKANADLSKLHTDHAAVIKAKHDGLDDSHEMKAHLAKEHEFHKAAAEKCDEMGKMCKAHADQQTEAADEVETEEGKVTRATGTTKPVAGTKPAAAGTDKAASDSVSDMVDTTVSAVVAKSLETIQTDPMIQARIQEAVLNIINAKLGDKIVPDHVRGVLPDIPLAEGSSTRSQMVPRSGQASPSVDTKDVPAEFASLVEA